MVSNRNKKERDAGEVEPPATKDHAVNRHREEELTRDRQKERDDASGLKPLGMPGAETPYLKTRKVPLKIGTWNVRTLFQAGKFDNLLMEMEELNVDIMGVSETRWTGSGKIVREKYTTIFSGGEAHEYGVAITLKNHLAQSMMGYWPVNNRIIMCKIQAKPFNLVILQAYAPTGTHDDEEVEEFYEDVESTLSQSKSGDVIIVMGDFNAKVGSMIKSSSAGKYGLGDINERGERLVEFCEKMDLSIANTLFKQHKRRLYTWKSPGDVTRNQIDYLAINSRFKNSIVRCKTYPGADIGSDHVPVIMKIEIKLKIPKRKSAKPIKYNISELLKEDIQEKYAIEVKNKYESLMELEEEENEAQHQIEKQWRCFQEAISKSNEAVLPKEVKEARQPWMTQKILQLMKERKDNKGTIRYKELDRKIKTECTEAKDDWLNKKCIEIESLSKSNKQSLMYKKIKEFCKGNTTAGGCIRDRHGNILFEAEAIAKRWTEYVEELFNADRNECPIQSFLQGPDILKEEVESALQSMKTGKASGVDKVSTEMLKALGSFGLSLLTEMCNKMYRMAYIPEELRTSIFVLLPKKSKAMECSEYRTISLMCHMLKLLLTVILRRIRDKINKEVSEEQAGFRKNSGTIEAIFNFKILAEKYIEMNKDIYACFIDYSKAFDSVDHEELIASLKQINIDENDVAVIANLYWQQRTQIRLGSDLSDPVRIKRGVRQGCVLSPSLFNLYTEFIFRTIEGSPGLKVGGYTINNLRYADDTVLLAESEQDLQELVTKINNESVKLGLKMNVKKTKTMIITKGTDRPRMKIVIDGKVVEQVDNFAYLGQLVTEDGRTESEVRRRIGIAKNSFDKLRKVLTSNKIKLETRMRLTQCYIWSVFMYGCETWTLTSSLEKRIDGFEMWIYRRMARISWKAKKSNVDVLKLMGLNNKILLKKIKMRKLRYYGHIRRHETLQKKVIEGKIDGKRGKGRRRKNWIMNIEEMTGMNINKCCQVALDRKKWRTMTSNLFKETEP